MVCPKYFRSMRPRRSNRIFWHSVYFWSNFHIFQKQEISISTLYEENYIYMTQLGELNKKWTDISTTRSITYARKVYHSVVTNDRLLSDTRRIIPTLRACIIELFILVFTIHLSAGGKWGLLTNIYALQIAAHETSASHSSGRIIYWKLGNFWVAVNDGRNAASYASPLVSGRFSSALFFPTWRDLFASKDPLDSTTVGVVGDLLVFFSPLHLSPSLPVSLFFFLYLSFPPIVV